MNFLFVRIKKRLTFALLKSGTHFALSVTQCHPELVEGLPKVGSHTKDWSVKKVHQVLLKHS